MEKTRLVGVLRRWLESERVWLLAVGLAVLLNLPSITIGWHLDDLVHRAQFLEVGPLMDSSDMTHRMFDFFSGDPDQVLAFKDLGVLPWWAQEHLKISFWRPLSAFTHVVDYSLWPESALWMHLHSVCWLALLIALTARLYRRLIPASLVAGAAAVLYALDDAHGFPTAFLANRNALIATTLGVLSLLLHHRWRQTGWALGAVLSPLAFAGALLAGESGVGAAAYLLGYAVFLEGRVTGAKRLSTLLPHASVGSVWLLAYKGYGYGTFGSDFYLDPAGQPGEWFSQFFIRAPILLLGQWFLPPASFSFAWSPSQALVVAAFGVAFQCLLFILLMPILRKDAVARFFAFGMVVSVVPITAGYPHDRLLFFVGIGGMGLLAMLLVRLLGGSRPSRLGRWSGRGLLVVHVMIAAPLQMMMTMAPATQEPFYADAPRSLPDDPQLESQRLVIVNPPSFFYGQYGLLVRHLDSRPAPGAMLMMAPGTTRLSIHRLSDNGLSIEAANGYLESPFDNVYRTERHPVSAGDRVRLSGVTIEVVALTGDGRPQRVQFTFDDPLEHESLRWVRYEAGRYVPFDLPDVGQTRDLEAVPFDLLGTAPGR